MQFFCGNICCPAGAGPLVSRRPGIFMSVVWIVFVAVSLSRHAAADAGIDLVLLEDGPDRPLNSDGIPAVSGEPAEWWWDGGVASPPDFSVDSGIFADRVDVYIYSGTVDAQIYYNVGAVLENLEDPTEETGTLYSGDPIVFLLGGYIKAIAIHPYAFDSEVSTTGHIQIKVRPPTLNIMGGSFNGPVEIIANASSLVPPYLPNIQLTVDGSAPTTKGNLPVGIGRASIIVTKSSIVHAVAWQEGLVASDVVTTSVIEILTTTVQRDEGFAGLLGWWDLGVSSYSFGNYTRGRRFWGGACQERYGTFIEPARVMDRQGNMGDAVLEGPECKGGVWDVNPAVQPLPNLPSLSRERNGVRGLAFDLSVNRGLYVSNDVDTLVQLQRMPFRALTVEVQLTVNPSALLASRMYGLVSAMPGWSLGYAVDALQGTVTFQFSVCVAANFGESANQKAASVRYTRPADGVGLGWSSMVAVYDRRDLKLYFNDTLAATVPACTGGDVTDGCGDVVYPVATTAGTDGRRPFVIGALDDRETGMVMPHSGLMGRVRVYDGVLEQPAVYAAWLRLQSILPDEKCAEGYFGSYEGSQPCIICGPGTYNPLIGRPSCLTCPVGYFTSLPGQVVCTACPIGKTTLDWGSGSLSMCVDPDECLGGTHNCPSVATCFNSPGSYQCVCNAGYSGDGSTCLPTCGDGMRTAGEGCDDGNVFPADGCSPDCKQEQGYSCSDDGGRSVCGCVGLPREECCQRQYGQCLLQQGWFGSEGLVDSGVDKGTMKQNFGHVQWVLGGLGQSCTQACEERLQGCVAHSLENAGRDYVTEVALQQAVPGLSTTVRCLHSIDHTSSSLHAPLLLDPAALPMVDVFGPNGEGSVQRTGSEMDMLGSVCYSWNGTVTGRVQFSGSVNFPDSTGVYRVEDIVDGHPLYRQIDGDWQIFWVVQVNHQNFSQQAGWAASKSYYRGSTVPSAQNGSMFPPVECGGLSCPPGYIPMLRRVGSLWSYNVSDSLVGTPLGHVWYEHTTTTQPAQTNMNIEAIPEPVLPPNCSATPTINTARRLCQCQSTGATCPNNCLEAHVQCLKSGGASTMPDNYAEEVAEPYLPCLDDPEWNSTKPCEPWQTIIPGSKCNISNGTTASYTCADYMPGGAAAQYCASGDGSEMCDACPVACGMCLICFRNGTTYYYGGVEKAHPDPYGDNYVTQEAFTNCRQGLAYCSENGYQLCKDDAICAVPCPTCEQMLNQTQPAVPTAPTPGVSVGECPCSEWYRTCIIVATPPTLP